MQLTAKRAKELSEQARVVDIHIELIEEDIMNAVHEGKTAVESFVPALNAGDELALVQSILRNVGYVVSYAVPHTPPDPQPGHCQMSPGTKLGISWENAK